MKKNVYWLYLFFTFPSLFSLGVHANANLTANSSSAMPIVSDAYFSMVADALLGLAIILAIYFFLPESPVNAPVGKKAGSRKISCVPFMPPSIRALPRL